MSYSVALGAEARLILAIDALASPELGPPDLSALPGAALLAHGAGVAGTGKLAWSCARAVAPLWVDGLEGAVLDGASAMTRAHLGAPHLVPGAVTAEHFGHAQSFSLPDARGRHLFGFDEEGAGIICTAICWGECDEALAAARLEATFAAPPASWPSELLAQALGSPRATLAVVALIVAVGALALVAARPRPLSARGGRQRNRGAARRKGRRERLLAPKSGG